MLTLIRYATRLFFTHVGLMLLGFVSLLQLLDILNNTDDILARHRGSGLVALLHYAWLRLPDSILYMLPFSVLMGSLLAVARLAQHNEVLALKAAGLSFYRLLLAFVPAALVTAAVYFAFSDRLAPMASRALAQWDAAATDEVPATTSNDAAIWVRDGPTLVRVAVVFDDGRELRGVTLFRRDSRGNLTERVTARAASFAGSAWQLIGVERLNLVAGAGGSFNRTAKMLWATALTPGHFSDLATPPSGLSLNELIRFSTSQDVGNRPTYYYQTWTQKRIALPAAVLIMLLLAAPVAQGLQRHGGIVAGLAAGLGLGFLYFVTDGFVLALGEAGAIPPLLAAWSPPLMFASLGGAALIRFEGY